MKRSEIKKSIEEAIVEMLTITPNSNSQDVTNAAKQKGVNSTDAINALKQANASGKSVTVTGKVAESEDDEFDAPEKEPSKIELKKIDKEFGSSKLAKKLSSDEKERLDKLETGIRKKLSNPTKENIAIVQQLINRADIKKLFKDGGKDLKALISDIIG